MLYWQGQWRPQAAGDCDRGSSCPGLHQGRHPGWSKNKKLLICANIQDSWDVQEKTEVILGTFISINVLASEVILALHVLCNFVTAFFYWPGLFSQGDCCCQWEFSWVNKSWIEKQKAVQVINYMHILMPVKMRKWRRQTHQMYSPEKYKWPFSTTLNCYLHRKNMLLAIFEMSYFLFLQ